jgi:hypothetical protein
MFVLTHRPPDPPDPDVTYLTGDIGEAVAAALEAAGGKNLEILGADVAGQCLRRGLVDEILVYVLPVLLGDGIRFYSSPGLARIDLEPSAARGRAPSPSFASASASSHRCTTAARAALICQHQARGADKVVTGNIDAHVEAERGRRDDDSTAGVLVPVG